MANRWYALHSKPNMELMLWNQLLVRNINTYYPHLNVKPVNPRSRKIIPFFPGYLFANIDLELISLSKLAWIPGVQRIVSFDGEPAWVPDHLVHAIQQQVEQANLLSLDPAHGFRHGDKVRITSGPFAGYQGIFDLCLSGHERVRILLKFLQDRQVPVELSLSQVVKIAAR